LVLSALPAFVHHSPSCSGRIYSGWHQSFLQLKDTLVANNLSGTAPLYFDCDRKHFALKEPAERRPMERDVTR
jgi:hypothetical protein